MPAIRRLPIQQVLRAICLPTDILGDIVYIRGDAVGEYLTVGKIDVSSSVKMPAIGVIVERWDVQESLIQVAGPITGLYTGLTINKRYWVGANGRPQLAMPDPSLTGTGKAYTQVIGRALSNNILSIQPSNRVVARIS